MRYKIPTEKIKSYWNNKNEIFLILNRFLKGAKITKIKPAKLLIKNRG